MLKIEVGFALDLNGSSSKFFYSLRSQFNKVLNMEFNRTTQVFKARHLLKRLDEFKKMYNHLMAACSGDVILLRFEA